MCPLETPPKHSSQPQQLSAFDPHHHHAVLQRVVGGGHEPFSGGASGDGVGRLRRKQREHAVRVQPQRCLPALQGVAPPPADPRRPAGPEANVRSPLLSPLLHRQDGPHQVGRPSFPNFPSLSLSIFETRKF